MTDFLFPLVRLTVFFNELLARQRTLTVLSGLFHDKRLEVKAQLIWRTSEINTKGKALTTEKSRQQDFSWLIIGLLEVTAHHTKQDQYVHSHGWAKVKKLSLNGFISVSIDLG